MSYWFVQDLAGDYQGKPILTSPHPAAVLTVNIGRPNTDAAGRPVPGVSLLGLQTRSRNWVSGPETYFVMVMLSIRGLASLFPATGGDTIDNVLDLSGLLGDGETRNVIADLSAAWSPQQIVPRLDRWLMQQIERSDRFAEPARYASACADLGSSGRVDAAAERIGVSRRQLHRWCREQLGLGPKEVAQLHRLQTSLKSVQTGLGDALAGFSDQAHQIREWRRRFGITPGAYQQTLLSQLAIENSGNVTHYL